jgi:hypothetical protein
LTHGRKAVRMVVWEVDESLATCLDHGLEATGLRLNENRTAEVSQADHGHR